MADNRKTFRLEDKAQAILTATKERRRCTENDAVNYLIEQTETQAKTISDQYNRLMNQDSKIDDLEREKRELKKQLQIIKDSAAVFRNLILDSSPATDQAGAAPGPDSK